MGRVGRAVLVSLVPPLGSGVAAAYGGSMVRKEPEPVRITSATQGHSADVSGRQRRYVISMTIRTLCFLAAVVSMGHWFMWVFLAASFFLPYIAVVIANTAAGPDPGGPDLVTPDFTTRSIEGPDHG